MAAPATPLTLEQSVELATRLRGSDARTLAIADMTAKATDLFNNSFHQVQLLTAAQHIWFRGRPCKNADGFSNLGEVIHRREPPDFGRANIPGRSAFYASWNVLTVLDELSAATGQYIHIVAARVLPGQTIPFSIFGELTHLIHSGHFRLPIPPDLVAPFWQLYRTGDGDTQRRWLYLDGFISEEFRKIRAKAIEYQITAALAEAAYQTQIAVAYPSVQTYGAQNIAIPGELFEARMEVVCTEVLRVDKFHGHGVYQLTQVRGSNDFEADGRINWNSNSCPFPRHPNTGQPIVPAGYLGWRPPKPAEP
jgi:hypothetical protein